MTEMLVGSKCCGARIKEEAVQGGWIFRCSECGALCDTKLLESKEEK